MLDIYATSVDYTPNTEMSERFFATVQNKMHWATHGHTAAEIIHQRSDAAKLISNGPPQKRHPPANKKKSKQQPAVNANISFGGRVSGSRQQFT